LREDRFLLAMEPCALALHEHLKRFVGQCGIAPMVVIARSIGDPFLRQIVRSLPPRIEAERNLSLRQYE
jgi:hypothetical protein